MIRSAWFTRRLAACAALLGASLAGAHDFWVQPSAFRAAPGALVTLDLRVGDEFPGEQVGRKPERIASFVALGPGPDGAEAAIVGQDGRAPAGFARFEQPGLYRVAYRSNPSTIELEPEKFEAYLREEGLDRIVADRAERGESARPGREAYTRYAKSLVLVGSTPPLGFNTPVGMKLEILPESDPFGLVPGSEFSCRVLLDGKPVEGLLVGARSPRQSAAIEGVRTDNQGRARFTLASPGLWLIHAVHMARAGEGSAVDWESSWASLTFEISGSGSTGR